MACGKVSADSDQRSAALTRMSGPRPVGAADHEGEIAPVLLAFGQPLGELQGG